MNYRSLLHSENSIDTAIYIIIILIFSVPLNDNGFLKCILETLEEQQMNWKKRNDAPEIQSLLIKINRKFKMKYPGLKIPTTMSSLTKRMYLQRRDV